VVTCADRLVTTGGLTGATGDVCAVCGEFVGADDPEGAAAPGVGAAGGVVAVLWLAGAAECPGNALAT
jgi:hypothetical protein